MPGEKTSKNLTTVGSGSYSVYLPKKWVDGWNLPSDERLLHLHRLHDGILVEPASLERSFNAVVRDDEAAIEEQLERGFLGGSKRIELRSNTGTFRTQTMQTARNLARRLDPTGQVTVENGTILFLPTRYQPGELNAEEVIADARASLQQLINSVQNCIRQHGHDAELCLEDARFANDILRSDLRPFRNRVLRWISTLELPFTSVADLQALAYLIEGHYRVGVFAFGVVEELLASADLNLTLLEKEQQLALQAIGESMHFRGAAAELRSRTLQLLPNLAKLCDAKFLDPDELRYSRSFTQLQTKKMQEGIREVIASHWGSQLSKADAVQTFAAYRMIVPLEAAFREMTHLLDTMRILGATDR